ncbi:hypothetical protein ACS0TY_017541 [Phlomoides rotata]
MSLLESHQVAPPPASEQSVPLIFFDITWLHFPPIHQILFYEIPDVSKPHFLETLVPKLKESLSLTLKHFFPLAGNLVYPLNPDKKPVIRYQALDSVSVTVSESGDDFDYLVGNQARDADKFYDFIPQMAPIVDESDHKILQALALKITLFPGRGLSIGLASLHCIGDASSFESFFKSWASINKNGEDGEFPLPLFDRSVIKYDPGLDSVYWARVGKIPLPTLSSPVPTNRVRATYAFSPIEIKKLKVLILERIPGLDHVSSFVVMAAYVWSCLAKSVKSSEEENVLDDDDFEFFLFGVDLRPRINVPGNYFGNCLSYGLPKIRHQELVGDEGFFLAAQAMSEEIKRKVINNENILEGAMNWTSEIESSMPKSILAVTGSTRLDFYGTDFGWGKARKLEINSTDGGRYAVSLCKSGDCEGGLEVGMSLPKVIMDAFAVHFAEGMKGSL